MNIKEVKNDISDWILNTLSVEHPAFSNMPPCPFAKKALLANKIEVIIVDSNTNYDKTSVLLDNKDVVAYVYDPDNVTPEELASITTEYNKKFPELVFLEDHPNEVETVQDFICNQGKYAFMFGATRAKVLKARHYLKGTKYYDKWDEEYKQAVWSR